jgi:hypothetical protein
MMKAAWDFSRRAFPDRRGHISGVLWRHNDMLSFYNDILSPQSDIDSGTNSGL